MTAVLPNAWAEDVNYAAGGDPWSGTPTKVQPSAGSQAKGLIPESPAGAQEVNYVLNKVVHLYGNVLTMPAMNFLRNYTFPTITPTFMKFFPTFIAGINGGPQGEWVAVNNTNDTIWRGVDFESFNSTTELSGVLLHSKVVYDFSQDTATGNLLAVYDNDSRFLLYTQGTTTWSNIAPALPASATINKPCMEFEPVSGNFILTGQNGLASAAFVGYTPASAPTTATASVPTGFVGATTASGVTVGVDGLGNAVAVNFDAAASVLRFSKSTDGGVTWSASTASAALGFVPLATSGSQSRWCSPVWNGVHWMVITCNTGFTLSKVFTSVDGVTWTLASSQSSVQTTLRGSLCCLGELWVSHNGWQGFRTSPMFSVDRGVTWHHTDQSFGSAHAYMYSDGQRLFAIPSTGTTLWISVATGLGF